MIYICIPTHNEQQTVGVVLWKLRQVLTDFPRDYQLLVADDASTDKTPEVLEPYTRVLPLTVIRSDHRQGYAASLEMLLREAVRRSEYPKRDVIVALQADFSDEPDDLVPLVKRLEAGADVAVGNKVSTTPETRTRRLSRSLARFFMRRQKWPEGVSTPFEGYRAYRLYAVRKAIEERAGRRLIRYDGWAGHAELLRAVLPHARRVDVVDVDDRPDRLQRPRREKPFAAALQVRAMAHGAEPQGVAGVEELDRIAATASRSRDRSTTIAEPTPNGRSRTNGGRTRTQRTDPRQARHRQQVSGRAERTRGEGAGGGEERQPRKRAAEAKSATRKPRGERSPRPRREPGASGQRRKPAVAEDSVFPAEEVAQAPSGEESPTPGGEVSPEAAQAGEAAEPKPKRRRRRRRRSGTKSASSAGSGETERAATASESGVAEASADSGDESGDAAPESEGGAAKKRRRRGGRRGGRGRRRPKTEGVQESGAPDVEKQAGAPSAEPQGAAPAQPD